MYARINSNHKRLHYIYKPTIGKYPQMALKKLSVAKAYVRIPLFLIISGIFLSCATPKYIFNEESAALQRKLKNTRTANIALNAILTAGSMVVAAFTGVYINYIPENRQFSRIVIANSSDDTINVNMFTDLLLQDSLFCDFTGIAIPPGEKTRLLVPRGTIYHLYFSNTPEPEDDEMIEVHCEKTRKIILFPGMTSIENNQL
jgi:hypothetical protein